MKTIFSTKAAPNYDHEKSREVGTPDEVEQYFNEAGDTELFVTVEEREEFERESVCTLDSDVLTDEQWTDLTGFLKIVGEGIQEPATLVKSTTPHTPTPWRAIRANSGTVAVVSTEDRQHVANVASFSASDEEIGANAELIVRAVNSHAALVALNEELVAALGALTALIAQDTQLFKRYCEVGNGSLGDAINTIRRAEAMKKKGGL